MCFIYKNKNQIDVAAGCVSGRLAKDVRSRRVERIEIVLG